MELYCQPGLKKPINLADLQPKLHLLILAQEMISLPMSNVKSSIPRTLQQTKRQVDCQYLRGNKRSLAASSAISDCCPSLLQLKSSGQRRWLSQTNMTASNVKLQETE